MNVVFIKLIALIVLILLILDFNDLFILMFNYIKSFFYIINIERLNLLVAEGIKC